jgi:hypothetical protein
MVEDQPDRTPGSRPAAAGPKAKPSLWAIALFVAAVLVLTASIALIVWIR